MTGSPPTPEHPNSSQTANKRGRPVIIEISSDEEATGSKKKSKSQTSGSTTANLVAPDLNTRSQRLQYESERLARQRAREQLLPSSSASSVQPVVNVSPFTAQSTSKPVPVSEPRVESTSQNFWKSAVCTTFNRHHPNSPNALRIEGIIGPKHRIKMALISTYVADLAWVHNLFASTTRIMVIKHDTEAGTFKANERDNLYLCHPPMQKTATGKTQKGCMHIKFFILYFDGDQSAQAVSKNQFCRIVIPTANAVGFDYEQIENAVWIQDFPLADKCQVQDKRLHPSGVLNFVQTLEHVLEKMGVPSVFSKPLADYDFRPAAANLVVSIQGTHSCSNSQYGQLALAKQLSSLGLQSGPGTGRTVSLECLGSSIGAYDTSWLNNFHRCASGHPPSSQAPLLNTKSHVPISILFPTLATVKNSRDGPEGGGTIFCNKSSWQKAGFPTSLFFDAISKRAGILMHVKMILGLFKPESQADEVPSCSDVTSWTNDKMDKNALGFLYIGSHNFTPAAWGRVTTKLDSKKGSNLEISNWELGVVLPVTSESQIEQQTTWQRPPKKYGHGGKDTKIPWMQYSYRG